MENPHEEKQAVLLERIIKNADKCHEAIKELNASIAALTEANHDIVVAAELFDSYRRNVEWNLKAAGKGMAGPILLDEPQADEDS